MPTETPGQDVLIGQAFGHYHIHERLGVGGMGVVYKAEDTRLHRFVALKFLPDEVAKDPQILTRFQREAEAASALSHPNICTIYDIDAVDGKPFIAMELLEGETLKECIAHRPLRNELLIEFGLQIADALGDAHAKGIIHRDIKSSNIFITHNGQAKLLDFGLAKLKATAESGTDADSTLSQQLTRVNTMIGTVPYMSPEQIRGEELDARSDLFSFGIVLYEMATARLPFRGETLGVLSSGILQTTPTAPIVLNPDLRPELQEIIDKALQKERDLRYQSAAEMRADLKRLRREIESGARLIASGFRQPESHGLIAGTGKMLRHTAAKYWKVVLPVVIILIATAVVLMVPSRRVTALSDKDTIVIGDFENKTGDGVFDDTLRQALEMDLAQSPLLNILSDRKVTTTLHLMGRSPETPVVGEVARELCERVGSKALIAGSISSLGSEYVLGLHAINCSTGDTLVAKQARADRKESVLRALDKSASEMRESLGESLASVQKFGTPVEEVTTPSLEALKAYSIGRRTAFLKGDAASLPYHKRAVELDPNFAVAYAALAAVYNNLGQATFSAENARKAYEFRDRVSERERYRISTFYYEFASGDIERATQTYELWRQRYPQDSIPVINLGNCYMLLGRWEKALRETEDAMHIEPNSTVVNANLAWMQVALNRPNEAEQTGEKALARNLDAYYLRIAIYDAAFLLGDREQMEKQVAWAAGRTGEEDWLLATQADTEAYYGRLRKAREYSEGAMQSARRAYAVETAALWRASAALREAEFGNVAAARREATAALAMFAGKDVKTVAAMALARAGQTAQAQKIAETLKEQFPENTVVQGYWLPSIRGAIEISAGRPLKAIEVLKTAAPYELGQSQPFAVGMMYPVYLRGTAYLKAGMGNEAVIEYQKILDHPGVVLNFPLAALANIQLGRAHAATGDRTKAHVAYGKFLKLWEEADSDIALLAQAKSEMAALR